MMAERSVRILNRNGLHARTAAQIVKAAAKFNGIGPVRLMVRPQVFAPSVS